MLQVAAAAAAKKKKVHDEFSDTESEEEEEELDEKGEEGSDDEDDDSDFEDPDLMEVPGGGKDIKTLQKVKGVQNANGKNSKSEYIRSTESEWLSVLLREGDVRFANREDPRSF